jgi:pyruvate/2-oxoglutarate dehydrogenase complex dihydrolipoamide acyltransferase (E2) component
MIEPQADATQGQSKTAPKVGSVRLPYSSKVTEATVTRWRRRWGEYVGAREPLLDIYVNGGEEFTVLSPARGVLTSMYAKEGQRVKTGEELGHITVDPSSPRPLPAGEQYSLEPAPAGGAEEEREERETPPEEEPRGATAPTADKKPSTPAGKVKVSFNLWPEEVTRLRDIAARRRTTVTAALQRAIADEVFLTAEMDKGAHVLLRYSTGEYREVIMHL